MRLDAAAAAAGVRLIVLDSIGSTNAEALRLARTGLREPTWIVAREQTAGRGRRGRSWHSPPGNLYATLLLVDPSPPESAAQLSLVAGVALHDAIADLAPEKSAKLTLKWPNDLLYDDAKLVGILVEAEGSGGACVAAIGMGVNCVSHPDALVYRTTDLLTMGISAKAEEVFAVLSKHMLYWLAAWDRGAGFEKLRREWLARAGELGRPIRVRTADAEFSGTFAGMDPRGALLLRMPDGATKSITSADVSHAGQA